MMDLGSLRCVVEDERLRFELVFIDFSVLRPRSNVLCEEANAPGKSDLLVKEVSDVFFFLFSCS